MKTTLSFENEETKVLLSKLQFKYFLNKNIGDENYNSESIKQMNIKYLETSNKLRNDSKNNKTQQRYYLEGQVRKMFTGGFLPAVFQLDESRRHTFSDFEAAGENWAYFDHWQRLYKRKLFFKKCWENIIKIGSILGIALSILKLLEVFNGK
jgi:hypothetical protein